VKHIELEEAKIFIVRTIAGTGGRVAEPDLWRLSSLDILDREMYDAAIEELRSERAIQRERHGFGKSLEFYIALTNDGVKKYQVRIIK